LKIYLQVYLEVAWICIFGLPSKLSKYFDLVSYVEHGVVFYYVDY